MGAVPSDFSDSDEILFDFLNTDLDLLFTFLSIAETARSSGELQHMSDSVERARRALESVRGFLNRLTDRDQRAMVQGRIGEAADALARFVDGSVVEPPMQD